MYREQSLYCAALESFNFALLPKNAFVILAFYINVFTLCSEMTVVDVKGMPAPLARIFTSVHAIAQVPKTRCKWFRNEKAL